MEDVYGKCSNPDCPTTCNKFLQFTSLNQTCRNCGCDSFNHQLLAIFISSENRLHWLDNSVGGGSSSGGNSVAAQQSAGNLKRGGGVVTSQNKIDITAALKQKFSPSASIVPPPKAKFAPPHLPFVKRMRHQGPQHHHQPASPIVKSLKLFIMPEETTHVPKSEAGRNDLEQTGQYFPAFPYLLADDASNTITQTDFEQIAIYMPAVMRSI